MKTNLELTKLASDVAFASAAKPASEFDAEVAAQAEGLSDNEYGVLKNAASAARRVYQNAIQADQRAAKQAAATNPAPAAPAQ